MYESEETVDRYDTTNDKLSTFNSPIEVEFLDMIDALGIRSVLDIGCGAGAFFHLLRASGFTGRYLGVDLSASQIARARSRFGDHFERRDVSTMSEMEFAQFDSVHAYSVFSFMSAEKQVETLARIMRSGARLLTETGITLPDVQYAPRSFFRHFGGSDGNGRARMTAVSFPYRAELEAVLIGHHATYIERSISNTRALNGSRRDGAAFADKAMIKRKRQRFERVVPYQKVVKLLMARITPDVWTPRRHYDVAEISRLMR